MKTARNSGIGVAAVVLLGMPALTTRPALAGPAQAEDQITAECKAKLAADYGPLGKGSDVVRRLYPRFDPSTFRVEAAPSYPLLGCDFLLRRKPVASLAVVLQFPSDKAVASQEGTDDSIFSDSYRYEIAELRGDSLDQASVARNRDALTGTLLLAENDNALPLRGPVRLDRTIFALSENEAAVAVRFDFDTTADGYGAYLSEYDELALFRPDGQNLVMILMVPLVQATTQVHCNDDDQSCGDSEEDKYIVRIAKHKTGGLYDLIIKNVSHPRKERPAILQWNGKTYVAAPAGKK
jgi:hypothetical protein